MDRLRILVLSPHTDDAELGSGGTLARARDHGYEVFVAVFCIAEDSLPAGEKRTRLLDEFYASMTALRVAPENTFVHRFPVRHLAEHRQEILDRLLTLRSQLRPTVVLCPSTYDVHQDHQAVTQEALRAFKHTTLWGYEMPWNNFESNLRGYVALNENQVEAKLGALAAYETQRALQRPYFSHDAVRSLAEVRGLQIGERYAEAFEVIRTVVAGLSSGLNQRDS